MREKHLLFYLLPFILLATLNAGGYRYGASDQAFYQPAVLERLDPSLFPRDSGLIAAQARLTTYDEVIAAIVRLTGVPLPTVFAVLHVVSLGMIAAGVWLIGRQIYRGPWAPVALLAAMTLRHAIARSGTNTLEGYFHPRQIAFGFGLLAVAAFLRGRFGLVAVLLACAGAVHPTAALWFAVWLVFAAAIASPAVRRGLVLLALPAAAAAAWVLVAGPLAGRLAVMDAEWLQMIASKKYLFLLQWPPHAWILNLGYIAVVAAVYWRRHHAGLLGERERALVLGSSVLVVVFLIALALQAARIVLAFQLQPARLFLIFDFLATVYLVWALVDTGSRARARIVTAVVLLFSIVRGLYVVAERPVVQIDVRDDDWGRVMAWARNTDKASGWLADPLHAVYYGTSVRVAGERDVFVEAIKDEALGIYDREVARRTQERVRALAEFPALSAASARALAAEHALDFLVTEHRVDLPLAFESGRLRVYQLR